MTFGLSRLVGDDVILDVLVSNKLKLIGMDLKEYEKD